MASILKVDKIRVTGSDEDSISFDNSGNITFNKTVTGDNNGLVKIVRQDITSATSAITFDNITSTYDSYRIIANVTTDGGNNCKLRMRFRVSSTDVTSGVAIYQGEKANRAASSSFIGANVSGGNDFQAPLSLSVYGGSQFFFNMDMYNINVGLNTEATNITPIPTRCGTYTFMGQMTSAADLHGGTGWWRTQNDMGVVNGIKFELTAGTFNDGQISLFGYST